MSDQDEKTMTIPRSMLEALASTAIIQGLDPEQQAYEKWLDDVDYEGPWPQIPWDDLSKETHAQWKASLQQAKLPDAKTVRKPASAIRKIYAHRTKEWTATSLGDSEVRNRPKCPLCTSLKKSIPCKGGPPCTECKRKGYTAAECQNYVPGQGNKGRRRKMALDASDRPVKRPRVRAKAEKTIVEDVDDRRNEPPSPLMVVSPGREEAQFPFREGMKKDDEHEE